MNRETFGRPDPKPERRLPKEPKPIRKVSAHRQPDLDRYTKEATRWKHAITYTTHKAERETYYWIKQSGSHYVSDITHG